MLWSKKPAAPVHEKSRAVGVDLTASRARGVATGPGQSRPIVLDEPAEDLGLFISLDGRAPQVGRAGYALCRKAPHAVCSNFLPCLLQTREWRCGRHVVKPEYALELTLDRVRSAVAVETDAAALVLPAYLSPAQVTKFVVTALRVRFPLKGTAVGPLALVADRAAAVLSGKPAAPESLPPDGVIPLRPSTAGPGAVVVVDADEYAASACVVTVDRDRVRLVGTAAWPRFSVKLWKDRLLDAIADRCVRLCRRDPRDSADAEQALFEQLDDALDRARAGQRVSLTVRTDKWFQDVVQQPDEFDGHCAALARGTAESVRELLTTVGLAVPPRAVWLTHEAGRLPGLARAVHQNTPEGTTVEVLPPGAVAQAAAALVPRWLSAELPRVHLDAMIPLPATSAAEKRLTGSPPAAPR